MSGRGRSPLDAVKLVCGLLCPDGAAALLAWARGALAERFGPIERESEHFEFRYTDYYKSISPDLIRCFFSFEGLRHPGELTGWKKTAVALEAESADGSRERRVNIDPGYLDGAKLVLASTKNNAQRIYIADRIYAEVTLCRRKGGWERFSYTFPDFKSGDYDAFLDLVRADWRRDIRERPV
jgi:hypothetical protein